MNLLLPLLHSLRVKPQRSPLPLLIPLSPFSSGDIGKLVLPEGMQNVNMENCLGITGKSDLMFPALFVGLRFSRTRLFLPRFRFVLLTSFPVFAGDVGQLQLPASMQELSLAGTKVEGTFARASRNAPRPALRSVRQNKV